MVLPVKNFTFDELRPVTKFEHLKDDFEKGVTEQDDTHFAEVVGLHNIGKDNGVQTKEQLIERTNNNFENRLVI